MPMVSNPDSPARLGRIQGTWCSPHAVRSLLHHNAGDEGDGVRQVDVGEEGDEALSRERCSLRRSASVLHPGVSVLPSWLEVPLVLNVIA